MADINVENVLHLYQALQQVQEGDKINLSKRVFLQNGKTHFQLKKNNVKIQGVGTDNGNNTLIKGHWNITGNDCTLQNFILQSPIDDVEAVGVTLSGNDNALENVHISGFNKCLEVSGYSNRIDNMYLHTTRSGMDIFGNKNKILNSRIDNCAVDGVNVTGNNNTLKSLTLTNVLRGLIVDGNGNSVILYTYIANQNVGEKGEIKIGLRLGRGTDHIVDVLHCVGITPPNYGVVIMAEVKNFKITNSLYGRMLMEQGEQLGNLAFHQ